MMMLLLQSRLQFLLYIQMELCDRTLKQWLEDRNRAVNHLTGTQLMLLSLVRLTLSSRPNKLGLKCLLVRLLVHRKFLQFQ